jgi:mRNA interferase MazF
MGRDGPTDVAIDSEKAGLRARSKVRMKLFTLDNRLIVHRAGSLSAADQRAVSAAVKKILSA